MLRDSLRLLLGYTSCTALAITGLVVVILLATAVGRLDRPTIEEVTSPLKPTTVQDLCQKLELPKDQVPCQPGSSVFAPDFFPAVTAEFAPGMATYADVEEKLGTYRYEREPTVHLADGTAYFRCWYDFEGDRVFPVVFVFTEEGLLQEVFATVGDD
jgi:hypothetical protein